MIVTITSWAPVRALSRPGDARPQGAGEHAGEDRQRQVHDHRQVELEADPAGGGAGEQHLAATADVEQPGAERQPDPEPGRDQRRGELQGLGQRPDLGGEVVDPVVVDRAAEQRGVGAPDRVPGGLEEVAGPGEDVARGAADLLVGERDHQRADEHGEEHGEDAGQGVAGGDLAQHRRAERLGPSGARCLLVLRGPVSASGAGLRGRRCRSRDHSFGRSPVIIRPSISRGVSPGTMPTTCPR